MAEREPDPEIQSFDDVNEAVAYLFERLQEELDPPDGEGDAGDEASGHCDSSQP